MTILVGILCQDGVVIGADSTATFVAATGIPTIEQRTQKIEIIDNHIILAGAGQTGLGQRFSAIVQKAWQNNLFQDESPVEIAKYLAHQTVQDFRFTNAPLNQYGALLAFHCNDKPYLVEFDVQGFQPELKTERLWYVSMGNGQMIVDPFLGFLRDVLWKNGQPSYQNGVLSVTWALEQAIQLNPGGINAPVQIVLLSKHNGEYHARQLDAEALAEPFGNIKDIKELIHRYVELLQNGKAKIPPVLKSLI
jgi:20S proteasome alpha/beta subunit